MPLQTQSREPPLLIMTSGLENKEASRVSTAEKREMYVTLIVVDSPALADP